VPGLCELYPGICLITEEKARKNLSPGRRRMPVGTMKTEYTKELRKQNIQNRTNRIYRTEVQLITEREIAY